MAGIGIRYAELARELCAAGFDVTVVAPSIEEDVLLLPENGRELECARVAFGDIDGTCDVLVIQGHLAHTILPQVRNVPVVVDLYDPWLLENLSYADTLGEGVFESDLRLLNLVCRRGDFFLCANEEQRSFYLGCLTMLGRVNPAKIKADPDARSLIDVVPFGVPDPLPPYNPYLLPAEPGIRRLLFGGLYDWYDPWTVLKALEQPELDNCRLLFVRNPNQDVTPQRLFDEVEAWCRGKGWIDTRVQFLDWVPWDRRFDLLRDVDLMIASHQATLETQFSMRTRFLEAVAAGCPVIASTGGSIAEVVRHYDAGAVVEGGDFMSMAREIERITGSERCRIPDPASIQQFVKAYSWRRAISPLINFCNKPDKDQFKPDPRGNAQIVIAARREEYSTLAFSVLVPTFNRIDSLPKVIEALSAQYRPPPFEVVIVDDGSTDDTTQWLREQDYPFPTKVINQANQGPAAARNAAVRNAENPYIALLGDDIIPDKFWLQAHARQHAGHKDEGKLAVVGHTDWHEDVPRTKFRDFIDKSGWQFGYDQIQNMDDVPFNFLYSSNLSMKRKLLAENPFNTDFPYPAWEDTELGYRLKKQGLRLVYEYSARAGHLHRPTVARMAKRQRQTGYVAVEFCRLHPELESFLWPTSESFGSASGPVVRTLRRWYAAGVEHLPVELPKTWQSILRDHYIAGIKDYRARHGSPGAPDARAWRIFPVTFQSNSPLLGHKTGSVEGETWLCVPRSDSPGHALFGPGFAVHDNDSLEARFFIRCGQRQTLDGTMVTLDVYDQTSDQILTMASLNSTDLSESTSCVILPFSSKCGQRLEFRVFWHGTCELEIFRVELHRSDRVRSG